MRYVLLIGHDDKNAAPLARAEGEAMVQGHTRVSEELRSKGKMVISERLRPEADATRVRLKGQATDGPFAETKEALGGFYLIECDTRQEAIAWAKKLRCAKAASSRFVLSGRCEVRYYVSPWRSTRASRRRSAWSTRA